MPRLLQITLFSKGIAQLNEAKYDRPNNTFQPTQNTRGRYLSLGKYKKMSNYVPGGQKKNKIFKKREKELTHALKNEYTEEKINKAVEKLRESKIQAIWASQSPANLNADEALEKKRSLIEKWESYSNEEIIDMYKKSLPNQAN